MYHTGSYGSAAYSFFLYFFCIDNNFNMAKNTDTRVAITTNKYLI